MMLGMMPPPALMSKMIDAMTKALCEIEVMLYRSILSRVIDTDVPRSLKRRLASDISMTSTYQTTITPAFWLFACRCRRYVSRRCELAQWRGAIKMIFSVMLQQALSSACVGKRERAAREQHARMPLFRVTRAAQVLRCPAIWCAAQAFEIDDCGAVIAPLRGAHAVCASYACFFHVVAAHPDVHVPFTLFRRPIRYDIIEMNMSVESSECKAQVQQRRGAGAGASLYCVLLECECLYTQRFHALDAKGRYGARREACSCTASRKR